MSAPTPLTDSELARAAANHTAGEILTELRGFLDVLCKESLRLETENATLKSLLAAWLETHEALTGYVNAACEAITPHVDLLPTEAKVKLLWASAGLRRLLSVEAPRPKPAVGPRLVVP